MDLEDPWYGDDALSHVTPIHEYISDKCCEICFNRADSVIANTTTARDKIVKENGISSKLYTVTNGYWSDFFEKEKRTQIGGDISILYVGGTYGGQANKYLGCLEASLDGKAANSNNITVNVLGESSSHISSNQQSPDELGYVSVTEVPKYLRSSDLLVVYTPPHYDNTGRIMLKSYGYARSGKPVLFIGPRTATYDFLKQHVYVERFDRSNIRDASEWILSNSTELEANKYDVDNSANAILAERSFSSQMSKLTNIANDLVSAEK
jgi:glycosyltransferase involved in cell wall biosynthesis